MKALRFSPLFRSVFVPWAALLFLSALPPRFAPAREVPKAKPSAPAAGADLTFFVVSDTHYGLSPRGDETVPLMVDKMNTLPGTEYPAEIGGGTVGVPRGVIHNGDITNDAREKQWLMFVRDYGLTGKEGRLKYPVYETFGNHDGGPTSVVRKGIKERNRGRTGLTALSENGMHYSWDWGNVHFVSLGVSVGTTTHPYDPQQSIVFLAEDLKKNVGSSGRPVILLHHFGFDPHSLGWWSEAWRKAYFDLIKGYNILAIIHGHAHESFIYQWNGFDVLSSAPLPPKGRQEEHRPGPARVLRIPHPRRRDDRGRAEAGRHVGPDGAKADCQGSRAVAAVRARQPVAIQQEETGKGEASAGRRTVRRKNHKPCKSPVVYSCRWPRLPRASFH